MINMIYRPIENINTFIIRQNDSFAISYKQNYLFTDEIKKKNENRGL